MAWYSSNNHDKKNKQLQQSLLRIFIVTHFFPSFTWCHSTLSLVRNMSKNSLYFPPPSMPLLPEVVKVAGGSFQMGAERLSGSELPIHTVTLPDFCISRFPITNVQFTHFLEQTSGTHFLKDSIRRHQWGLQRFKEQWLPTKGFEQHPAIGINWHAAQAYCTWLSEQTDLLWRLLSETEWEYAARGGQHARGFRYAGSQRLAEVGWFNSNGHKETKPVGLKLPNELGIYDMSGNIYEWCVDHWHPNYEGAPTNGMAWMAGENESTRVIRGGSWEGIEAICRTSSRFKANMNIGYDDVGFRIARS